MAYARLGDGVLADGSKTVSLTGAQPKGLPWKMNQTGRLPIKGACDNGSVGERYSFSLEMPVNFFSQFPRALESNHPSSPEDQVITRRRVSASTLFFIFDAKFAKPGDQNILIFFQRAFNNFQKGFNDIDRLFLGKAKLMYRSNDIAFG